MAATTNIETRERTDLEALKEELEAVKKELVETKALNKQYEEAYRAQGEKYNNLFGLFANTVDYVVGGSVKKG